MFSKTSARTNARARAIGAAAGAMLVTLPAVAGAQQVPQQPPAVSPGSKDVHKEDKGFDLELTASLLGAYDSNLFDKGAHPGRRFQCERAKASR